MRSVKEVSELAGVSVRTLHYYDAIGLLKPSKTTEAGYRLYDDAALCRLRSILLFRELQFPLREIRAMLDHPAFSPKEALEQQIALLEKKKNRIDALISLAKKIQTEGESIMEFDIFRQDDFHQYAEEVKERWGATSACREYEQKRREGKDMQSAASGLMDLFAQLGALRHLPPAGEEAQEKIRALQAFISEHFYTCTKQILSGLGELYAGDARMKRNIDDAGGEGTAEFARQAIAAYCAK
ncbi:MerR family transcriptional regulator [Christensenellaceae bacterium 44-20]